MYNSSSVLPRKASSGGATKASELPSDPVGGVQSTNVQAVIAELDAEKVSVTDFTTLASEVYSNRATNTALSSGLGSKLPLDGPASRVAFTPTGNIAATTVQAALAELDAEKASLADLAAAGGGWTYGSILTLPAATSANYMGIDPLATEIEILFNGVSPNLAGFLYIALFDNAGNLVGGTGYYSSCSKLQNATAVATNSYNASTSFIVAQPLTAANFISGSARFNKMPGVGWNFGGKCMDSTGQNFEASGTGGTTTGISGIKFSVNTGVAFDSGAIVVRWRK